MGTFVTEGDHQLSRTIRPQGAKNEALQVICATLPTSDPVVVKSIPDILDADSLTKSIQEIGVKVTRINRNGYAFQADKVNLDYLDNGALVNKCSFLHDSVLMIGPLSGRSGRSTVAKLGGDKIGRRRLGTHFLGFKALGARLKHDTTRDVYHVEAANRPKGCYVLLDETSITGTASITMAVVMTEGTTTMYNAAREPHIQQLCRLLDAMGANISSVVLNLLIVVDVRSPHKVKHTVLPDMIKMGSFIDMAAIVGNGMRVKDVAVRHLGIVPGTFG